MEVILVLIFVLSAGTLGLAFWGLSLRSDDPFRAKIVPIREARSGQVVRVAGRICLAETVTSVFGEAVVLFDLELRGPPVLRGSGYSQVLKESGAGRFVLEDHSGRVRVDASNARLVAARGTPFTAIDERVVAVLDRRRRFGESRRRTLRQRYISVREGDRVSVVGRCRREEQGVYRSDGGAVLEATEETPLLVLIERSQPKDRT